MSAAPPLEPQSLETLERFLQQVEAPDLFAYLQLDATAADTTAAEAALQRRRAWAQGQQANPKYRTEALWLIKNMPLLRDLLLEQADAYRAHLRSQKDSAALETLGLYIRGALADKILTARAEAAILRQGRELGLADRQIQHRIQELLDELEARRTPKGLASAPTIALDRGSLDPALRAALDAGLDSAEDSISAFERQATAEVPRPPAVRSLQPGQAPPAAHAPHLELDGPEERQITVGREPAVLELVVRNTGTGRMAGQVNTDRPWITATPERLDPALAEQTIRLTINPRKMTRQRAAARVTVATRSAGNRSILVQARRRSLVPLLALGFLGTLGLLALLKVAFSASPEVTPDSRLIINVDPPTGDIFIDETLISTQGVINITEGFPVGAAFPVRIAADGFAPWSQVVTVPMGQTIVLKPELSLTDTLSYLPASDDVQGALDERLIKQAIADRSTQFDRCFARHTRDAAGTTVLLAVRGYVDALGHVLGLQFPDRSAENPDLEGCLRRQFRALSLPLLDVRADYAVFEHVFRYTVAEPQP